MCSIGKLQIERATICCTAFCNLVLGPFAGPVNAVLPDPVVRPAGQVVTSNRRGKGNGLAVIGKTPLRRAEWRDDLVATTTAATMCHGPVLYADVKDTVFECRRHELNELMAD
jgi:hypothetical protein